MKRERISMLRQWLNENRITNSKKFVTNADIEYFLGLISSKEMKRRNREEKNFWNNFLKSFMQRKS
jgi:hypothetical protein